MNEQEFQARLKELYLPPTDRFVFVDVPELRYAAIDGAGALSGEGYPDAVKWLFAAIHPIKRIAKARMGRRFVEPPLEALWWADDMEDFIAGRREKLKWRMMIVLPAWADAAMFEEGVASASEKLGAAPAGLRIEPLHEGRCVQIMHVGRCDAAAPMLRRLHCEFLPAQGLEAHGHHHEIYLNDPNRVAPEKLKTVFRQPVREAGSVSR